MSAINYANHRLEIQISDKTEDGIGAFLVLLLEKKMNCLLICSNAPTTVFKKRLADGWEICDSTPSATTFWKLPLPIMRREFNT